MPGGGITALGRGLRKRCPTCGGSDLFVSFYRMRERCPDCGMAVEREEGYWVGAMIVLIGVTEALFGIFFVGGMLVTWPEVPWTGLLVGGIALNLVVPFLLYPWSKTAWMGLHDAFVPNEPSAEAEAIAAQDARRRAAAIAARDAATGHDADAVPGGRPTGADGRATPDPDGAVDEPGGGERPAGDR